MLMSKHAERIWMDMNASHVLDHYDLNTKIVDLSASRQWLFLAEAADTTPAAIARQMDKDREETKKPVPAFVKLVLVEAIQFRRSQL